MKSAIEVEILLDIKLIQQTQSVSYQERWHPRVQRFLRSSQCFRGPSFQHSKDSNMLIWLYFIIIIICIRIQLIFGQNLNFSCLNSLFHAFQLYKLYICFFLASGLNHLANRFLFILLTSKNIYIFIMH